MADEGHWTAQPRGRTMTMRVYLLIFIAAIAAPAAGLSSPADLLEAAHGIETWLVDVRRELHKYPELMFEVGAI